MMAGGEGQRGTEGYGGIESDGDANAVARIVMHAFAGGSHEETLKWIDAVGRDCWRVLRDGEWIKACLFTMPMGIFLGGRSVPMSGVVAVGVAPEARGRGLATRLMLQSLREQREDGFALSGLFSAKQGLYRRVGFEQAGHFVRYRVAIGEFVVRRDLELAGDGLTVRTLGEGDRADVEAFYRAHAAAHDGMLDRGAYVWGRIAHWRGEDRHGWVIEDEKGEIEAYIYLSQRRKDNDFRQEIFVGDWQARSLRGWAALMRFCREFSSMGDEVVFRGSPTHPVCFLMDEQRIGDRGGEYWMLRVLDVAKALSARGYGAGTSCEAHLRIEDETLGAGGDFVLRVDGGEGTVEAGGRGEIVMSEKTLAALVSGYLSMRQAIGLGLIGGTSADALSGVFEGGVPAMVDQF